MKVPVVACRFAVREATALELGDYRDDLVFGVEWSEDHGRLEFDGGAVAVACARPNLEIEATDRVVRHVRVRRWHIGGLETGGEWQDD
jgi:hypothetical protein